MTNFNQKVNFVQFLIYIFGQIWFSIKIILPKIYILHLVVIVHFSVLFLDKLKIENFVKG